MKHLFLLLIPFFGSCVTHSPMSEMVMFNKNVVSDTLNFAGGKGLSIFHNQPSIERFKEEREASFNYAKSDVDFSASETFLKDDKFGLSFAAGTGTGADLTINVIESWYTTASVSVIRNQAVNPRDFFEGKNRVSSLINYYFAIQRPMLNTDEIGIGAGLFYQSDSREYREVNIGCSTCSSEVEDFGIISLNSIGFKTTLLLKSENNLSSRLIAYTKVSKLVDYNEFYLSAGVTFIIK